ncbi:type IV secretory system conjugative DNA transfer family protein [Streptomyces sclerotialus]|uniref:type IV secretory system conjugative DNA transfer family protein n=1 Tax=Streptomyces sclerotialus TaxID=1957 RepID=UPI0004C99BCF
MTEDKKNSGGEDDWTAEIIFAVVSLLMGSCLAWLAAKGGAAVTGGPAPDGNPLMFVIDLAKGDYAWPGDAATAIAVGELLVPCAAVGLWYRLRRRSRDRTKTDEVARGTAEGENKEPGEPALLSPVTTAQQPVTSTDVPGVPIGRSVHAGQPLYGSFEDMHIDIWGPRRGKTTRRAIPAVLDAPGAVLVTSNKRDIVDATRGPRAARGPVWVFDPQHVVQEPPGWWWNPLSYVTDIVKARKLADHFVSGSRDTNAYTDGFFGPAAQTLLSNLLLAAATGELPITQVCTWLSDPKDDTPERILRSAGHILPAHEVRGVTTAPDDQRGGIYGTAQQIVSFLVSTDVSRWVTPADGTPLPEFDPHDFVRSGGVLYALSREGQASAGPLVTALTVAVVEAAEEYAAEQRDGRLPVPLIGVLDEVANICRWRALPDLFPHYGARGIILMALLQSWSQGVAVWGERGMEKLWSAANIRVYGGGTPTGKFLGDLSRLTGEPGLTGHGTRRRPKFGGRSGKRARAIGPSAHQERALHFSDLSSMPLGRVLVLASGSRPALVETVPWWEGPHAAQVNDSLSKYGPGTR